MVAKLENQSYFHDDKFKAMKMKSGGVLVW